MSKQQISTSSVVADVSNITIAALDGDFSVAITHRRRTYRMQVDNTGMHAWGAGSRPSSEPLCRALVKIAVRTVDAFIYACD